MSPFKNSYKLLFLFLLICYYYWLLDDCFLSLPCCEMAMKFMSLKNGFFLCCEFDRDVSGTRPSRHVPDISLAGIALQW